MGSALKGAEAEYTACNQALFVSRLPARVLAGKLREKCDSVHDRNSIFGRSNKQIHAMDAKWPYTWTINAL